MGATEDLQRRYQEHLSGEASRTTQLDPPVALLHSEEFATFSQARTREAQVKRWALAKKEARATGDPARLKYLRNRLRLAVKPDGLLVDLDHMIGLVVSVTPSA